MAAKGSGISCFDRLRIPASISKHILFHCTLSLCRSRMWKTIRRCSLFCNCLLPWLSWRGTEVGRKVVLACRALLSFQSEWRNDSCFEAGLVEALLSRSQHIQAFRTGNAENYASNRSLGLCIDIVSTSIPEFDVCLCSGKCALKSKSLISSDTHLCCDRIWLCRLLTREYHGLESRVHELITDQVLCQYRVVICITVNLTSLRTALCKLAITFLARSSVLRGTEPRRLLAPCPRSSENHWGISSILLRTQLCFSLDSHLKS